MKPLEAAIDTAKHSILAWAIGTAAAVAIDAGLERTSLPKDEKTKLRGGLLGAIIGGLGAKYVADHVKDPAKNCTVKDSMIYASVGSSLGFGTGYFISKHLVEKPTVVPAYQQHQQPASGQQQPGQQP